MGAVGRNLGGLSLLNQSRFLPSSLTIQLSYTRPLCLACGMRKPDKLELEFAMLMFLIVVPMAYYSVRMLFAILAG